MIERLLLYLDLLAGLCRSAVAAPGAGLLDLLLAGAVGALSLYAVYALVRGLRGRDDAESERIKRAILDD